MKKKKPEYRIRVSKTGKLFLPRIFTSFQKLKKIMEKLNKGVSINANYYATNTNNDSGKEIVCW